jgi:uncharacterized protein (DUF2336 family)
MAFGFLSRLFGRRHLPPELRYEDARRVLESHQLAAKRELASRDDAPPESLYYLACDDDAEVRGLVAGNPATPHQANELLRTDADDEVRIELARKIARLIPGMPEGELTALQQKAIALLERLAEDELPRVRTVIAREIAACGTIPKRLAMRLAHDAEIAVCGSILQYSPLLSDEDLVEIIATTRVRGAIEAIALRKGLSGEVADAVVASLDIPAIAALLANPSAEIREQTMNRVIAQAAAVETLHLPLVMRTDLSMRAIRRIATFVSRALVDELARRNGLDEETAHTLKARAQAALEAEIDAAGKPVTTEAVRKAYAKGDLGDEIVTGAATMARREPVVTALSLLTGVAPGTIDMVLDAQSGRGITALCWKAGLSMRTALSIQAHIAHVPQANLVLPRDGIDYPLAESELLWHLQYFGIEAGAPQSPR